MSDGFPVGSHWGPTAHALTFAASAVTFLGTIGHALQSLFYALAAVGAFCAGVASLGQFVRGWRHDRRQVRRGGRS